ncbi:hypothetical protein CRYUN_Cryun04dG0180200 [Craigia yunnanensis]
MAAVADSLGWTMRNKGRQAEINRSDIPQHVELNPRQLRPSDSLPYEFAALCLQGSINVSFQDRKEGEVPLIDETSWESRHEVGMDLHHHAIEFDIEFWPVEHPMEPQDEDQPVKCPMPASSSINDGKGHKDRVSAESSRKISKLPEMVKKGITVATEPPVRAVRKRHHNLTRDNHIMEPLVRMPPLPRLPTQNLTIFQMLQEFDKFDS